MKLQRLITGGQTGADQAAWRAAKAAGIPTGGAMLKGFLTEEGPRPEFAELYGAYELATTSSLFCTDANVRDSDATLWFGDPATLSGQRTLMVCKLIHKPCLQIIEEFGTRPSPVAEWLARRGVWALNVAGNPESQDKGIGERVESFLGQVFESLVQRAAL